MMTKSKKSYRRHNLLLQDSQVKAWYDEVGLGLESTAKNYLRMIGIFAERSGYSDAGTMDGAATPDFVPVRVLSSPKTARTQRNGMSMRVVGTRAWQQRSAPCPASSPRRPSQRDD